VNTEDQRRVARALSQSATLSSLTLCHMSDQGFVEFVLEQLAPQSNLEELLLHCGGIGSTFSAPQVAALVQQQLPLLRTLELAGYKLNSAEAEPFLSGIQK
jgi:hypothetical protein